MATGLPELFISDDEARDLADAVQIVSKEYGVKISGKTAAGVNLLMTAVVIYAPKALAIWLRMQNGKVKAPAPEPVRQSATFSAAKSAGFNPGGPISKPDWA